MPFASSSSAASAATQARIRTLETALARLECAMQEHAQEVASSSAEASSLQPAVYIQNSITATIHQAWTTNRSRTLCVWNYLGATFRARRRDVSNAYRELNGIANIPGHMLCDRCLPTERAATLNEDLIHDEVSADEQ